MRNNRTQGNSRSTMSGDPSSELLSTTNTSNGASSRIFSRLARQSRRSFWVFQLQMVTLSSKSGIVALGPNPGRRIDRGSKQNQPEVPREGSRMLPQEPDQAAVRLPDHAPADLFGA